MLRCGPASTLLLAALLAAGCTRRVAPARMPVVIGEAALSDETAAARAAVLAFVAAEAAGDPSADTLLATGADFIAQGIRITNRPRLAAMVGRGEAGLDEARTQVAGGMAWVVAIYRFRGRGEPERGRGTFVLERRPAGWRIKHVHSSWVERWD